MAIISCPKCRTQLRVPDGSTAAVRCPKCQTVFSPPKSQPAFEVVDEPAPPKAAKPAPRPASPPPPKPAQPATAAKQADFEFVDDDEPKGKPKRVTARREDDDDDDDDRPRKKRRRDDDDDDEDDRPRSRKRDRDDDDDDDDDRPRKKKRKYGRDEDEDDWADSGKKKVGGAGAAKVGMLLLTISLGLYAASFALFGLFTFVSWMGGFIPSGVMIIPGLLGLGSLVTAATGAGFCIAGPARARGLAIATTAVAAVHLILAFVIANNLDAGMFSPGIKIQAIGVVQKRDKVFRLGEDTSGKPPSEAKMKEMQQAAKDFQEFEKDNKDDIEEIGYYIVRAAVRDSKEGRNVSTKELNKEAPTAMRWADLGSHLGFLDQIMEILCYHSKLFTDYLLSFFTGLVDLAQLILTFLLIGAVGRAVRQDDAAGKAKIGLIAVCAAVGIAILLGLLSGVLQDNAEKEAKKAFENITNTGNPQDFEAMAKKMKDATEKARSSQKLAKNFGIVSLLLTYMLYTGMLVMPAIGALQASSAAGRRSQYRR